MSYMLISGTENLVSQPIERRVATFVAVLAIHIGLILLLVLSKAAEPPSKKQGSLSVFALAAAAPLARPVPIAVPIIPATSEPVNPSPAEIFAEQQGAKGDPDGEVCSPIDAVTAGLVTDPLLPDAINRVPRDERSISEAIVMWNAEWSAASATDTAPLAGVRSRVLLILETLPPDCLATRVNGPRLIAIPEQGYTTFLTFGSGEWSWQQLIDTETIAVTEDNEWTWGQILSGDFSAVN